MRQLLLLFATQGQRTWVVSTDRQLFYVLDDRSTQASGRWIQRVQAFSEVEDVRAIPENPNSGAIYIGAPPGWYYSVSLHPDPRTLENRVWALIGGKK